MTRWEHELTNAASARDGHEVIVLDPAKPNCWNCGWPVRPVEPRYRLPETRQFVEDMEAAGLEVEHYHGRFFWQGPAVRVDDLQDAMRHTSVKLQYDNMGLGWIVYPVVAEALPTPGEPEYTCSRCHEAVAGWDDVTHVCPDRKVAK